MGEHVGFLLTAAHESHDLAARMALEDLKTATGDTKLPTLKLTDGTVLTQSRSILTWVSQQT